MKERNIVIHCLVLLMLIAGFAACASSRTSESTGEYVDDSVITTKIKALLAEDDFLRSFQISVETYRGTVQLSGFVNSQQAVDKAGQIARSVKGVTTVKNSLIVRIGDRCPFLEGAWRFYRLNPLHVCAAKSFAVARRTECWPAWSWSSRGAKKE